MAAGSPFLGKGPALLWPPERSLSYIPDSIVTMFPGPQELLGRHCKAAHGAALREQGFCRQACRNGSGRLDGTLTNCVLTVEIRSYLDESFLYRTHHSLCQQGRWPAEGWALVRVLSDKELFNG